MTATGERHHTRAVRAGRLSLQLRCSSPGLRDLVATLFRDLDPAPSDADVHVVDLVEEWHEGEPMIRLVGASWPGPPSAPVDVAFDLLVGAVNQLALDAEADLLHLHAAVVASRDHAVVIAAPSGTGKSILTASLVDRGCPYLTDETATVSADGATVSGFPKPITIKRGGRSLLPEFADHAVAIDTSERTSWQVPASSVGTLAPSALAPTLLVLLDRDRDRRHADPTSEAVEPADATAELLQLALDAGRFGEHALRVVGELVRRCRCIRVRVGTPSATADLVEEAAALPPQEHAGTMDWVGRPVSSGGVRGLRIPASVSTVVLDSRVVVHDESSRRVAAFDETGSELWHALLGADASAAVDADTLRDTAFVDALVAEGFLVDEHGRARTP